MENMELLRLTQNPLRHSQLKCMQEETASRSSELDCYSGTENKDKLNGFITKRFSWNVEGLYRFVYLALSLYYLPDL